MRPVFQYQDYREYLKDFYEENKRKQSSFTFRQFAKRAGVASHMHLKLVMEGERNLSNKSLPKFVLGLKLKAREAEYFEALVYFNQSKESLERARLFEQLAELRRSIGPRTMNSQEQMSLFSKWYLPVVYELTQLTDFREDPEWISNRLKKEISRAEAKWSLMTLEQAGLLKRDERKKLRSVAPKLTGDDEIENLLMRRYHASMMERARGHLDDPIDEREYGFLTVATTRDKSRQAKAMIKEFLNRLHDELALDDPTESGDELLQFNLQMFKL